MKSILKTKLSLAILLIVLVAQVFGQNGLYINAGGGYGISIASNSSASSTDYSSNGSTNSYKISNGSGSFGKGLQFGATVGYMVSENIGAELNIGYLIGGKSTITQKTAYSNTSNSYEDIISGNMLRMTPGLRFSVGKDKLKPYMRFGLVIGMASKIKDVYTTTSIDKPFNNPVVSVQELSLTGGISLGFSTGLGVNYKLSEKLGIFAELGLISQAWAPNKGTITKSTVNGFDNIALLTPSQKEINFVNNYSETIGYQNPSLPSQALKTSMPFSSVGLNIGVQLSFGKTE